MYDKEIWELEKNVDSRFCGNDDCFLGAPFILEQIDNVDFELSPVSFSDKEMEIWISPDSRQEEWQNSNLSFSTWLRIYSKSLLQNNIYKSTLNYVYLLRY